jgi:hypothetical protein
MFMIYELIDLETGNVLGAYESEESALRFVRDFASRNLPELLTSIALIQDDDTGRGTILSEGAALLDRAASLAA